MKAFKRILVFLLAVISLAAAFAVVSCANYYSLYCRKNVFVDVPDKEWYELPVRFCYNYGYMTGVADAKFAPADKVTRGMAALTLYNIDNATDTYDASPFSDVDVGAWYHNGCAWASSQGIVAGVGGGKFAPNDYVTNEQLCVMFMRYAQSEGIETRQRADLSRFSDGMKVSLWADKAVAGR